MDDQKLETKAAKDATKEALFNETLTLKIPNGQERSITVELKDSNLFKDELIGSQTFALSAVLRKAQMTWDAELL